MWNRVISNRNSSLFVRLAVLCGGWLILVAEVHAGGIPEAYQRIAHQSGIPPKVFYAIAHVESAKRIKANVIRPWPWTLNVEGRPERYPTRRAAWLALNGYLQQGKTSIDIGLMQINWRYHRKKLRSPWLALDPYHNLQVGAHILKTEYNTRRDWRLAIGAYHSPGIKKRQRQRAARYRKRVTQKMTSIENGRL